MVFTMFTNYLSPSSAIQKYIQLSRTPQELDENIFEMRKYLRIPRKKKGGRKKEKQTTNNNVTIF
jgi:hypothetical protein